MNRLREVLSRDHWWAELWSGVLMLAWGIQNLIIPPTYKFFAFRHLFDIIPEVAAELIAVSFGTMQIMSLILMLRPWRWTAAFGACWFYSLMTMAGLASNSIPPGVMLAAVWVPVNMFAISRMWAFR